MAMVSSIMLDYQAIITHMNLTGQSTANGDVTGDGRVDLRDLRLWRDHRTDIPALGAIGGILFPSRRALRLPCWQRWECLAEDAGSNR